MVIADDHLMFRQGLALMIRARKPYRLLGEAADGAEAWSLVQTEAPEIAILDYSMPELKGTEVTERVVEALLPTKCLILTMHTHDVMANEAYRAGALGCLLKDDAFEDLELAIDAALRGDFFVSRSLSFDPEQRNVGLSPREKAIVRGIIEGQTNKELADRFQSSVKTVETHRARLMRKLGARNTADIVRLGLEQGL